jgi:hypothetical protein
MSSCRAVISIPKTCQRCGVEFGCGGSCCWCDEVALDAGVRENLRQQFSDCLCRTCLEQAQAEAQGARPEAEGLSQAEGTVLPAE